VRTPPALSDRTPFSAGFRALALHSVGLEYFSQSVDIDWPCFLKTPGGTYPGLLLAGSRFRCTRK
jgi:hypothetical protein